MFSLYFKEFRIRLFYLLFCFLLTFFTAYLYSFQLIYLLAIPLVKKFIDISELKDTILIDRGFIFTNITEAFNAFLYVSFFITIVLSLPYFFYHFWQFLKPGLYFSEYILLRFFFFGSFLFLIFSVLLTYFLIIPSAWAFFLSFETKALNLGLGIHLEPRISEYIHLLILIFIYMSIFFQLPWFLFLLIKYRFIDYKLLVNFRKIFITLVFFIGALLTPPDVFSQLLVALPFLLFYEIFILIDIVYNHYIIQN